MAFSTSFFTPEAGPAGGGQTPYETKAIKNESPAPGDNWPAERRHGSPDFPPSDRSQPPPSIDGGDHEIGDDTTDAISTNGTNGTNGIDDINDANSTSKMPAAKKKKGTAAALKAPAKRGRPATGPKKTKPGGPKKAKSGPASKKSGRGASEGGDGHSSESDNGPYCLCRGPDDHRFMIACDRCEDWFHGECIGMDKHTGENLVQKYICPNCGDGGRYTTRYKKMCSLSGCDEPARIYDAVRPSIFCSSDHCQAWWEELIATLPRSKSDPTATAADHLTQSEFMGLLDSPASSLSSSSDGPSNAAPDTTWHLGTAPFSTPDNFWDLPSSSRALTSEEQSLLSTSAASRYQLGEEIVLCKKMLQLIELALQQRETAVAAGKGTAKDLCGYDARLDAVGATHQFALFLQTPQGEAIFKSGHLDPIPPLHTITTNGTNGTNGNGTNGATTNGVATNGTNGTTTHTLHTPQERPSFATDADFPSMCPRKKCKPHNGWSAILAKTVKHDMKELAAQAKEKLDGERRVRDGAAGRFRRRIHEANRVVVLDESLGDGNGGGEDGNGGWGGEMDVDG